MIACPHCGKALVSQDPLTKLQQEIYRYLVESTRDNGYAPSFDEIADRFEYKSLASVHEHLRQLEAKGFIRRAFHTERAIVCLVHPDEIGVVASTVRVRA